MLGFRVWDRSRKEMYYNGSNSNGVFIIDMQADLTLIGSDKNEIIDMFDYTPMQSTGLKDSTGKEIFEEDILQIQVNLDPDGYSYLYTRKEINFLMVDNVTSFLQELPEAIERMEVRGNRFENPELLEKLK